MITVSNYRRKFYVYKVVVSMLAGWGIVCLLSFLPYAIKGFSDIIIGGGICVALAPSLIIRNNALLELAKMEKSGSTVKVCITAIIDLALAFVFAMLSSSQVIGAIIIILVLDIFGIVKISKSKIFHNESAVTTSFILKEINWGLERAGVICIFLIILFISITASINISAIANANALAKFVFTLLILFSILGFVITNYILSALRSANEEAFLKKLKEKQEAKIAPFSVANGQESAGDEEESVSENAESMYGENFEYNNDWGVVNKVQTSEMYSYADTLQDFTHYFERCKLNITQEEIKDILAAISASRAIWLKCGNVNYANEVARAISKYFSLDFESVRADCAKKTDLFQDKNEENQSKLLNNLSKANTRSDKLAMLVFENVETENYEAVFEDFIEYFKAPGAEIEINTNLSNVRFISYPKIKLNWNTWSIFVGKANESMPACAIGYMTEVQLEARAIFEMVEMPTPTELPALMNINDIMRDALNKNYISLNVWKKIDKIEEYLEKSISFKLTNPVVRQMEQYGAVMIEFGADINEVVDKLMSLYLLPQLKGFTKAQIDQEDNSLYSLIEGMFGMDNLPITQKLLKEMDLN